ncbi:MAG: glycoside hydrolase family 16 protein [Patescibacteria group bacterium]
MPLISHPKITILLALSILTLFLLYQLEVFNDTEELVTQLTENLVAISSSTDDTAQEEPESTYIPTSTSTLKNSGSTTANKNFPGTLALHTAPLLKTMRLTFNEDFNELSRYVDQNGNVTCEPGGRGIWQSVYHFCSRTIAPNYDSQLYIDQNFIDHVNQSGFGTTTARNSTWVKDGILTIEVKPSDEVIKKAAGAWAKYTSGLLTTQFSFSQQYGYFEMRAQVPTGDGIWPAFWLLPIDKSWPPEIDVMESFGGLNRKGEGGNYQIHYASHTKDIKGLCGTWFNTGVDITAGFHTYGVNWQPDGITYYFDGTPYAFCPPNPDANQPFYMLLNVAVGSEPSWSGMPTSANTWPVYMNVDYVRAYQNK